MRRRCWLVMVLLSLATPVVAAPPPVATHRFGEVSPRPRPPGTLRLATYNLLNLFDGQDDPDLTGEVDDKPLLITEDRARSLAAAIRAVDADVLALQEVESAAALQWFRDTYLKDAGYAHLASFDVAYARGIECSLLSRLQITTARIWEDLPLDGLERRGAGWAPAPPEQASGLRMRRSPLYAELRTRGGYELSVFVVHHKSGAAFDYQREAEALAVVGLLEQVRRRDPSRNIAVMGDFNAAPWDKSLRVYLEAGLIDTLAHRTVRGPEAPLYKTHESDRVLDYILLGSGACRELVIGSAHVYGTPAPPEGWNWQRDPEPIGHASDHYPVVIDLVPKDVR